MAKPEDGSSNPNEIKSEAYYVLKMVQERDLLRTYVQSHALSKQFETFIMHSLLILGAIFF